MRQIAYSLMIFLIGAAISCAGAPLGTRLIECLTDPDSDTLWCDGKAVPWKGSGRYVCHPLDQHEEYLERRR